MDYLESVLFFDPQRQPEQRCPYCGGCVYPPGFSASAAKGGIGMTLLEMSRCYEEAAVPLRQRLRQLRQQLQQATDPEEIWHLKRRIAELTPMLTQMNELADLTAHYYDRGYYRSEKYTL